MTPQTAQGTSFHEKSYPDPGAIVDRISFYAENETFHILRYKEKGKRKKEKGERRNEKGKRRKEKGESIIWNKT
jgi:hypothetical protein